MWFLFFFFFLSFLRSKDPCESLPSIPGSHLLIYGYDPLEDKQTAAIFDSETYDSDTCEYDMKNRETFGNLNEPKYAKPQYIETYEYDYECDQKMSVQSLNSFSSVQSYFQSNSYSSASFSIHPNLLSSKLSFWQNFGIGGSMSTERENLMNMITEMRSEIVKHSLVCFLAKVTLRDAPNLLPDFKKSIENLPRDLNETRFSLFTQFFNKYGTHYPHSAKLGGSYRKLVGFFQCELSALSMSLDEVASCFSVDAGFSIAEFSDTKCSSSKFAAAKKNVISSLYQNAEATQRGGDITKFDFLKNYAIDNAYLQSNLLLEWISTLWKSPAIAGEIKLTSYATLIKKTYPNDLEFAKVFEDAMNKYIEEKYTNFINQKNAKDNCIFGCPSNGVLEECQCMCSASPGVDSSCCSTGSQSYKFWILSAHDYTCGDESGGLDLHIEATIGNQEFKTREIDNEANPKYNLDFDLDEVNLGQIIKIRAVDSDTFSGDDIWYGSASNYPKDGTPFKVSAGGKDCSGGYVMLKIEMICPQGYKGNNCDQFDPDKWNNFTAIKCPKGTKKTKKDSIITCDLCEKGQYQDLTDQDNCKDCPENTYSPMEGMDSCIACSEGQYSGNKSFACIKCPYGQTSDSNSKGCFNCTAGSYNNVSGSACSKCSAGSFNSVPGAKECGLCSPGSYTNKEGSLSCTLCGLNTYSNIKGGQSSSSCLTCVNDTYSYVGATECYSCDFCKYNKSCIPIFRIDDSSTICIEECDSKYHYDKRKALCIKCPSSCSECDYRDGVISCINNFRERIMVVFCWLVLFLVIYQS